MYIIAHRGYHQDVCENTLDAFSAAIALGVDGIETDVHVDKYGTPIIFHDRRLPNGMAVKELSHQDIQHITNIRIPTLAQALETFTGTIWNIEIKDQNATNNISEILNLWKHKSQILVTSFSHKAVIDCVIQTGLEGGLLISHQPVSIGHIFSGIDKSLPISTLVWDIGVTDHKNLVSAVELGIKNVVYGFSSHFEHALVDSTYVSGIITDYPEYVDHIGHMFKAHDSQGD